MSEIVLVEVEPGLMLTEREARRHHCEAERRRDPQKWERRIFLGFCFGNLAIIWLLPLAAIARRYFE